MIFSTFGHARMISALTSNSDSLLSDTPHCTLPCFPDSCCHPSCQLPSPKLLFIWGFLCLSFPTQPTPKSLFQQCGKPRFPCFWVSTTPSLFQQDIPWGYRFLCGWPHHSHVMWPSLGFQNHSHNLVYHMHVDIDSFRLSCSSHWGEAETRRGYIRQTPGVPPASTSTLQGPAEMSGPPAS